MVMMTMTTVMMRMMVVVLAVVLRNVDAEFSGRGGNATDDEEEGNYTLLVVIMRMVAGLVQHVGVGVGVVALESPVPCTERNRVQPLVHVISSSEEIVGSRHEEVTLQRHVIYH